ncbi:MAG TPA: GNAT family protein [Gaiellaceae bacterium]|nr:GNAT family protein [Gaiellaceae bacterium]
MSAPILTDGLVTLRPLEEKDFAAYIGAFAEDPELANMLGVEDDPRPDSLRDQLERDWVDPPLLRVFEWVIADAATDDFLGTIMLHSCFWNWRRAETGFWLAPSARGRGVMSHALALLLDWCFDVAGLERMELTALPENEIVPKIAERFGYVYEGTLRKRNFERGRRVDLLIWGLLADERPARGSTPR